MPTLVYLVGEGVLLDGGAVAISPACCCPQCAISYVCETREASRCKVGCQGLLDAGNYYTSATQDCATAFTPSGLIAASRFFLTTNEAYNAECPSDYSGTISTQLDTDEDTGVLSLTSCSGSIVYDNGVDPPTTRDCSHIALGDCFTSLDGAGVFGREAGGSVTRSNEYTTDMLQENVEADFEATEYDTGESCGAAKLTYGAFGDNCFTLKAFRVTITIETLVGAANVEWDITFTPSIGSPTMTHHTQAIATLDPVVIEVIPTLDDDDGAWTISNIECNPVI